MFSDEGPGSDMGVDRVRERGPSSLVQDLLGEVDPTRVAGRANECRQGLTHVAVGFGTAFDGEHGLQVPKRVLVTPETGTDLHHSCSDDHSLVIDAGLGQHLLLDTRDAGQRLCLLAPQGLDPMFGGRGNRFGLT